MLNRVRLTPEERRRQLLGIGLRKFVERPVQELSLDEVADEARVSRGLLFHYFPTKTAYHRAVVEAAGRRVLRNVRPDAGRTGRTALHQLAERYIRQIVRRRAFYLALVYGQLPGSGPARADDQPVAVTLRSALTDLVVELGGLDEDRRPVAHGWVAYVEDRALGLGEEPGEDAIARLTEHVLTALDALAGIPSGV